MTTDVDLKKKSRGTTPSDERREKKKVPEVKKNGLKTIHANKRQLSKPAGSVIIGSFSVFPFL